MFLMKRKQSVMTKEKIFGYDVIENLLLDEESPHPDIFIIKLNMVYNKNDIFLFVKERNEENKFFSTELSKEDLDDLKNKRKPLDFFFNKDVFVIIASNLSEYPKKVYIPEKDELKQFHNQLSSSILKETDKMNSSLIVLDDTIFFLKSIITKGIDVGFYCLETDELLFSIESELDVNEERVYYFVAYRNDEDDVDVASYFSLKELFSEEDEFEKNLLDNKFGIRSLSGY